VKAGFTCSFSPAEHHCICLLLTTILVASYVFIRCYATVVPVQNANVVKITDFGLAKLLDADQDVFKAAGGKVC